MVIVVLDDSVSGALQEPAKPQLSDLQRLVTHIDAVVREKIESIQHGFIIPLSAVQRVKVGDPIRTEHHGFTVDHECRRPIIAAPREQPYALAFTLDDQAKTVVLDLVKEIRSGWDSGAARWMHG